MASSRSPAASASPWLFLFAAALKLLLIPSYRSTDFDVHRHWLALTNSLPIDQWYTDASSQWTLDYPPFFAYFSYLLSLPSPFFDRNLTSISHFSPSVPSVFFMRLTVIAADLMLLISITLLSRESSRANGQQRSKTLAAALTFLSPALLIVDHVHFQYNGFLLGLMMISLALLERGRDLSGGIVFAVLLCSKHLFLVAAPVYFVYLLRHYCFHKGMFVMKGVWRLGVMGVSVIAVFGAAFGPFAYYRQMPQVLNRLFPFGRGLCHAYWAPNFWALYVTVDKVLALVLTRLGFPVEGTAASFTGGLVGNSSKFSILPEVTPAVTFLLVILAMFPCLVKAFLSAHPRHIIRWVAYACTCGFIFGWHVHEKASLHFTIPLGVISMNTLDDARHYFFLSIVSCYSMFPLLFDRQEYPVKLLLLAFFAIIMWTGFSAHFASEAYHNVAKTKGSSIRTCKTKRLVGSGGIAYLLGLVAVEFYRELVHHLIFHDKLPFLPRMMVSIYCSFGMMYSWIWQLRYILAHT